MREASDEIQLAYATSNGYVFTTSDVAALRLHELWMQQGKQHKGILYIDPHMPTEQVAAALTLIDSIASPEEMANRVLFAHEFVS